MKHKRETVTFLGLSKGWPKDPTKKERNVRGGEGTSENVGLWVLRSAGDRKKAEWNRRGRRKRALVTPNYAMARWKSGPGEEGTTKNRKEADSFSRQSTIDLGKGGGYGDKKGKDWLFASTNCWRDKRKSWHTRGENTLGNTPRNGRPAKMAVIGKEGNRGEEK